MLLAPLVLAVGSLALSLEDPLPRALSAAEAREDLALFREAVVRIHPGLGRYAPEADFLEACGDLDVRLDGGTTDLELYRELSLIAARLRCGHTRVEAPGWLDEYRATHATRLPFRFRLFDGRMLVEAAPAGSPLAPGTEVLAIEGASTAELVRAIAATVPVDGWTDSIRPSRLEGAYEFAESGFDHYLPLWVGLRTRFRLEVRAPGVERPATLELEGLMPAAWDALGPAPTPDLDGAVSWSRLDERTALLCVGTFVNYRRPVDAEALFAGVFGEIRAAGCERLVLDLRDCGGGSSDVAWTLARFLVAEPFAVGGVQRVRNIRFGALVPHLTTWEPGAFEMPEELFEREEDGWYRVLESAPVEVTPHPERFRGPITVLVGPYVASGSTLLVGKLQELGAVRVVGEPTGGSVEGPTAGLIFFLTLPRSGVRVNLPVVRSWSGIAVTRRGLGVQPDVRVSPTLADVLAGRDPVLDAALAR